MKLSTSCHYQLNCHQKSCDRSAACFALHCAIGLPRRTSCPFSSARKRKTSKVVSKEWATEQAASDKDSYFEQDEVLWSM